MQAETILVAGQQLKQRVVHHKFDNTNCKHAKYTAKNSVPESRVQEWPSHEAVTGPHQLHHGDFLGSGLNVHAHRIADDEQGRQTKQHHQREHGALTESEDCRQAFAPLGVVLDHIDTRIGFQLGQQGGLAIASVQPRRNHEHARQRIVLEHIKRFGKAG